MALPEVFHVGQPLLEFEGPGCDLNWNEFLGSLPHYLSRSISKPLGVNSPDIEDPLRNVHQQFRIIIF